MESRQEEQRHKDQGRAYQRKIRCFCYDTGENIAIAHGRLLLKIIESLWYAPHMGVGERTYNDKNKYTSIALSQFRPLNPMFHQHVDFSVIWQEGRRDQRPCSL
jgi:hypothetical protein